MFKLLFLCLLVLIGGIGIGIYYQEGESGGITPDSVWWTLDRIGEWIELNLLTWDHAGRLELRLSLMQERLDELADLERIGKLTSAYAAQIRQYYVALADAVVEDLKLSAKEAVDAKTEMLLEKVESVVSKQQASLTDLLRDVPEEAKPITETFSAVQSAYEQAAELFRKEN